MTLTPEAENHGRRLAERVIDQATRYGLGSEDVAVMISRDIERHTLAMEAVGVGAEEIATWATAVQVACRSRVSEERRAMV